MVYLICKVALEIIIYSRLLFASKCSYAHLLDCILTDLVSLCIFSVIKNIWLGVVIMNLEPWAFVLCLEWSNSHFRCAPEVGCNVQNSHLKPSCLSSPGVSTAQPAIQLPGFLICSGNLLPHWGTGDWTPSAQFRGLNRDIWCHLGCSGQPRGLPSNQADEQWRPACFQVPQMTLLTDQGIAESKHHLLVKYTLGICDTVN